VIEGRKVIEVRLRGVSKALLAQKIYTETLADCFVTAIGAIGDDRTDEDLFRALPASSATVVVGTRPSCARFRVADHREVRRILRELVVSAHSRSLSVGAIELPFRRSTGHTSVFLIGTDDS
jgi:trehalose 6-phosphate synthase/phosphatase